MDKNIMGEAKLYYMYMMADGEVSDSEERLYDAICKDLNINRTEKDAIIYNCRQLIKEEQDILKLIKEAKIDIKTETDEDDESVFRDMSSLARILWNLVNLGYADGNYSESERSIVSYLKARWSIDDVIYVEMIGVAESILSLNEYREWINKCLPNGYSIEKKNKEIDSDISQLLNEIKITIEEMVY